jgi:hypothetical protein
MASLPTPSAAIAKKEEQEPKISNILVANAPILSTGPVIPCPSCAAAQKITEPVKPPEPTLTHSVKKKVCREFVEISGFRIRYVQNDPLPQHIAFLQLNGLQGLDFVKIPISEKEDRLYLAQQIVLLLTRCGINAEYVQNLINSYNDSAKDKASTKPPLLSLFTLARHYAESNDFEFLV